MNSEVLIIGLVVGTVNYLFRYLPLRLGPARKQAGLPRGKISLLLDSIGIASICALLVVSSAPEIVHNPQKLLPTLIGFLVICGYFYKTNSIIFATLFGALSYGLTFKLLMILG
ncbi:L-valine transporter subunit YgaH [Yersinia aldovae]|uniref:L-valine exporter n=1 Tax=Yersinia aldovae TaxID=29483 RepID=A0A0T9UFZ8_YERAL|nr:L-valine transporter subunit YgaH [Yersinia aldovae]AJJ63924.1 branched-chain amino acid transport family protein [Yersinia aldovae 670-83]CNJ01512.1 putative L-valine exporter [Yersinia aldovae]CNL39231.1 putative L-valine exporter [Yersinia aldovae]CNL51372.1 putative L-valine exporter [Yersinia aldovae]